MSFGLRGFAWGVWMPPLIQWRRFPKCNTWRKTLHTKFFNIVSSIACTVCDIDYRKCEPVAQNTVNFLTSLKNPKSTNSPLKARLSFLLETRPQNWWHVFGKFLATITLLNWISMLILEILTKKLQGAFATLLAKSSPIVPCSCDTSSFSLSWLQRLKTSSSGAVSKDRKRNLRHWLISTSSLTMHGVQISQNLSTSVMIVKFNRRKTL